MVKGSPSGARISSQQGDYNLYVYIKRVRRGSCTYYYLVVEKYLGNGKRRPIAHIPVRKILEEFGVIGAEPLWCGGWDLNPRRPTPSGPKPDPFDQARAPPHLEGPPGPSGGGVHLAESIKGLRLLFSLLLFLFHLY